MVRFLRKALLFATLFIFSLFFCNYSIAQEGLIRTRSGEELTVTIIPVVNGRFIGVDDKNLRIISEDEEIIYEISLSNIKAALKWYNVENEMSPHRIAALGALLGGATGATVKKITSIEDVEIRELITDPVYLGLGAATGAAFGYIATYTWKKLFSKKGEDKEGVPYRVMFYDSEKDSIEKLKDNLEKLEIGSYLEVVVGEL